MFKQEFRESFDNISNRIAEIAKTENTYTVAGTSDLVCDVSHYSENGLLSLGKTVGFPSQFVEELHHTNPELANTIIRDRTENYFGNGSANFIAREFLGKVYGVVSNEYNFFDDTQAAEIIHSSVLAEKTYAHALVTPERLHLRAIDDNAPFRIGDDESNLFFCYFIDNSMVGLSSFKVQLGIYRQACTNGLIMPIKEFVVCRRIHRGYKDIVAEFNESVAFLDQKRDSIIEMLNRLTTEKAEIETLHENHRLEYLARKLTISIKESKKIMTLYTDTYGGKTKWDMVNAITEFARDERKLARREHLEKKAILVA